MAFTKLRERFDRKQAERVFLEAQRALMAPQGGGLIQAVAYILAALILLIPVFFMALGLWIIAANWFQIVPVVLGALILIFGYILFPRYRRIPEKVFGPKDLPATFELITAVSEKIGTHPPEGVHLFDTFNAYAGTFGRRQNTRIIGIGIPLWRTMTPQERVAIIAHEMAHYVNGDPARGNLTGAAMHTVAEWDYFLSPDIYSDEYSRDWTEIITEIVQLVLRLPVLFLGYVLMFATYNRSQRAEYLADGIAARVAGAGAMTSALHKFDLTPLIEKEIQKLYPFRQNQNGQIFDVMAGAVNDAHPDDVKNLQNKAAQQKQSVDDTHPPTLYRVGFISALGDLNAQIDAADFDFDQIDVEIASEADRLGKKLMQMYEDTTM